MLIAASRSAVRSIVPTTASLGPQVILRVFGGHLSFGDQQLGGVYWPTGNPTVALWNFEEAFASIGYEVCSNGDLEPGYEKVALYVDRNGTPRHAARQAGDGAWLSKLGPDIDIRHMDVDGVSGDRYGRPVRYMRRPTGNGKAAPEKHVASRIADILPFGRRGKVAET